MTWKLLSCGTIVDATDETIVIARVAKSSFIEGSGVKYIRNSKADMERYGALLSSAPELLAACKRALVGFKNSPPRYGEDRYEPMLILADAIEKAEGKS